MWYFNHRAVIHGIVTQLCNIRAATILHHETQQAGEESKISAVNNRPSASFRRDQSGTRHVRQMERQGIGRNVQTRPQRARRCAGGAVFDQQTERPQAGFLRQGIKSGEGVFCVHISIILELSNNVNRERGEV